MFVVAFSNLVSAGEYEQPVRTEVRSQEPVVCVGRTLQAIEPENRFIDSVKSEYIHGGARAHRSNLECTVVQKYYCSPGERSLITRHSSDKSVTQPHLPENVSLDHAKAQYAKACADLFLFLRELVPHPLTTQEIHDELAYLRMRLEGSLYSEYRYLNGVSDIITAFERHVRGADAISDDVD